MISKRNNIDIYELYPTDRVHRGMGVVGDVRTVCWLMGEIWHAGGDDVKGLVLKVMPVVRAMDKALMRYEQEEEARKRKNLA